MLMYFSVPLEVMLTTMSSMDIPMMSPMFLNSGSRFSHSKKIRRTPWFIGCTMSPLLSQV